MQLRQFLWIFLRCAHVTVNGMNRNVRTVCSILWNCYDFFFSYHIIYLPGNFCKFSGQFILFEQYFLFSVSLCSISCCLSCVICLCIVCLCIVCTVICCFGMYVLHKYPELQEFHQDLRSDSQHCRNHRMPQTEISRNLHHHQPYHC